MSENTFQGFPKGALRFFAGLEKNNSKAWFEDHREAYEKSVLAPARAFVYELGERLKRFAPGIVADPRVNKSLFRINRDTRFARDKSPYKTQLGVYFYNGGGKRMETGGYYFHLEKDNYAYGVGMHQFSREALQRYREALLDKKKADEFLKAITAVTKVKEVEIGRTGYKRVPRGIDPDHPMSAYLKFDGIHTWLPFTADEVVHSRKLLEHSTRVFKKMAPLNDWVVKHLVR